MTPTVSIADLFCGAGGTSTGAIQALHALGLGRRAVTIELNPDYVALIRERCNGLQLGLPLGSEPVPDPQEVQA